MCSPGLTSPQRDREVQGGSLGSSPRVCSSSSDFFAGFWDIRRERPGLVMDVCSVCFSQGLPLRSLLGYAGQGLLLEMRSSGGWRRCWPTAWSRCWFMVHRVVSTQGSTGAPEGACREEAGAQGETSSRRGSCGGSRMGAPWCRAGPRQSEGSTLGK